MATESSRRTRRSGNRADGVDDGGAAREGRRARHLPDSGHQSKCQATRDWYFAVSACYYSDSNW